MRQILLFLMAAFIPLCALSQTTYNVLRLNDGSSAHKGVLQFGLSDVLFESNPEGGANYGELQIRNWSTAGYVNTLRLKSNGYVGIGTVNPVDILDVNGRARFRRQGSSTAGFLLGGDALSLQGWGTHNPYIEWLTSNGTRQGYMGWNADRLSLILENGFNFTIENGNVGIGTHLPDAKLTVKGDIHTREVRVDLSGAVGPDYVFEKNYDLLSLSDLEAYIKKNKHLPEVPSAKEMEENGLNLKEMNLLLLKKVEELTLHLIEQNKKIVEQQLEIDLLKNK